MTMIRSTSIAAAATRRTSVEIAAATARDRVALDYFRTFITLLVLAHHSALAYRSFGRFDAAHYLWSTAPIVDRQRWLAFDLFALFNDVFFMSWMFLLSGLFVAPSLARKGSRLFLRDRCLRLGLPFAIAVTVLMPLAHYPSFRMTGAEIDFGEYWRRTLLFGPWPAGPAWFIWLLLAFDAIAAALYRVAPGGMTRIGRWSSRAARQPTTFFAALVVVTAAAYVPVLLHFGAMRWLAFGPFSVQVSRVLLYAAYFLAGFAIGAGGIARGLVAPDGALARRWAAALATAIACYGLVAALQFLRVTVSDGALPAAWQAIYALAFVLSCGASGLALLALFLRFAKQRVGVLDSLCDNAYGIYLVHYVFVVWLQYALLDAPLAAVAKAAIVFAGALVLSWGVTAALRRAPVVARVI
jgi:hypothetical protein